MILPLASDPPTVVVVVGTIIVVLIFSIYRAVSSATDKDKIAKKRYDKALLNNETQLVEANKLYSKRIFNDEEFKNRKEELTKQRRNIQADYYLKMDRTYKELMKAFIKGHITEEQKERKTKEILTQIFENILRGEKKSSMK